MLRRVLTRGLGCLALLILPVTALAECGQPREVTTGDTILKLADEAYGDPEKWTLIYYANQAMLDQTGFRITAGMKLMIPCESAASTAGTAPAADPTPLQRPEDAEMVLVTGGNYAPFTERGWPGEGMVTELINAALEASPDPVPYEIVWEDDWSQHLFPILNDKTADMGFPWYRPDCAKSPDHERCRNFHFSDPLVDVLIMLFVRSGDGFTFESDADVVGKRLCRPQGYFTHDLDRAGRDWLSTGAITLVQPATPRECFEALTRGEVDAVTLNVFVGAQAIGEMGLRGQVVPLERPLSSESLHVIISKTHWRGTTHLYRINAGLRALRDSARYDEIVGRHLGHFWDQIKTN